MLADGRKSVPGHVSRVKYASSFLLATFNHSLFFVSLSLLQSVILIKVHFKSQKYLVSLYASAFLPSTARLLVINFLNDIVISTLTMQCNFCIVKGIAFLYNYVYHLCQVKGRCSREWEPRTRFDVFIWRDVIRVGFVLRIGVIGSMEILL